MNTVEIPKQELWAQYHTVGPEGFVESDGELAIRPTASEASRIAGQPDQLFGIAWIDFSLFVGNPGAIDEENYRVGRGESFIATSKRSEREIVFKPVSSVLERGQLTKHTATWLGWLAAGNHSETPDKYKELAALL
jgi:hypothetical protein